MGVANSYMSLGRQPEALKLHQETLELERPSSALNIPTLKSMHNLGVSDHNLGRHTEALELYEEWLGVTESAKLAPSTVVKSMH